MTRTTPNYKFRLLCKRCNSYRYTSITITDGKLMLKCAQCGVIADHLDEVERLRAQAATAPEGFVSVELLNIERAVSDDLREQNAKLRGAAQPAAHGLTKASPRIIPRRHDLPDVRKRIPKKDKS
jgi:hypothetical protein